ncbi:PREDICTED: lebercilin-like protein [Polistes dominula]|uniref:Lebercilin-like protein n=1 Tax=Polistes dominula TaxID=743375 RepID=A0ABM1IZN4_POLDO|nr:PREDICTED: lebercilin-like protein [Polistes dominula]
MQTEVPTLPELHLNNIHENVDRKQNNIEESKSYSLCRSTCPSSNKKCLHPLLGESYKNSMRVCSNSTVLAKSANKNTLAQRVVSAKMLRIKQLQNQLADAHYHLNELANENRLLKALQKRQDSALRRYEGTTAELPKIINSHHEELRILQIKHKKLKALHKKNSDLLKEKENELHSLQTQNKHLLRLSKDRNLVEREKLQMEVSDLNNKIMQQQENIQMLQRKLALESKSLKHQLFVEVSKHKQTQKSLQEALEKVKDLEHLVSNKTRKQLLIDKKDKILVTQSLTNLRNVSTTSSSMQLNTTNKYKKQSDNLPTLSTPQLNDDMINNTISGKNANQQTDLNCTEIMIDSRQTHKLHFQKESHDMKSFSFDELVPKFKNSGSKLNKNVRIALTDENDMTSPMESENKCKIDENFHEVSKEQHEQLEKFSDYTNSEHENDEDKNRNYHWMNTIKNSHDLYTRMINSTDHDLVSHMTDSKENGSNVQFSTTKISYNKNPQKQDTILEQQDNYDYRCNFETNQEELTKDSFIVNLQNDKFNKIYSDTCSEDLTTNDTTHNIDLKVLKTEQNVENLSIKNTLNDLEYNLGQIHIQDEKNQLINDHENLNHLKLDTQNTYDENGTTTSISLQQDESEGIEKYSTVHSELDQEIKHSEIDKDYSLIYDNISYSIDKVKDELQQIDEHNYDDQHKSTNSISEYEKTIPNGFKVESTKEINNDVNNTLQMDKKKKSLSSTNIGHNTGKNCSNSNEESDCKVVDKSKSMNYNKEKLLATMKAIDNNEDIDFFINRHFPKRHSLTRFQITENLFRGLPAHSKESIIL